MSNESDNQPKRMQSIEDLKKKPDNRCLAVISINLFAISTTATAAMFVYGK